jgi:hypothetical protein
LIKLVPAAAEIHVLCSSKDKGPAVKKVCGTGCIGCRICTKWPTARSPWTASRGVDYAKPLTNEETWQMPRPCIRKDARPNS